MDADLNPKQSILRTHQCPCGKIFSGNYTDQSISAHEGGKEHKNQLALKQIFSFPRDEDGNILCPCGDILKQLEDTTLISHANRPKHQNYLQQTYGRYWYSKTVARDIAEAAERAAAEMSEPPKKKKKVNTLISSFFSETA